MLIPDASEIFVRGESVVSKGLDWVLTHRLSDEKSLSRVTLFRPWNYFKTSVGTDVLIDGEKLCKMRHSEHIIIHIQPGRHQVMIDDEKTILEMVFRGGADYAIKIAPHMFFKKDQLRFTKMEKFHRRSAKTQSVPETRIYTRNNRVKLLSSSVS
jgi:hypothetical protein